MIVHKGESYEFDTRDWNRPFATKYDSALAMYLDMYPFDASDADEDDTNGMGDSAYRFGRRILWCDDRGFVGIVRYDDDNAAREEMERVTHVWHHCSDCGHMDYDRDDNAAECECDCHIGY